MRCEERAPLGAFLFRESHGLSQGLHRNTKEKTRPLFLFLDHKLRAKRGVLKMEKGKLKSKQKEVLGGIIVVIAIFIGRGYYQQHSCFKTAEELFVSLQTDVLSEVEGVEVKEAKIEELNKKYPVGSFGVKVCFWIEWCIQGVCEYSGTGRIVYRNKQTGAEIVCRANLLVSVTKADHDNLNVKVSQEFVNLSVQDFTKFVADSSECAVEDCQGGEIASARSDEGTSKGVRKAKITDWAAYVEELDAQANRMTEIKKKELCAAEIGRPVEIEIVVKDVSEMSDEDGNPICVISSWLELQGGIRNVYVYVCNTENTCETYVKAKNLTKDSRIIVSGAVLFLDGPVILGVDPRIVCHQIKLAGAR